MARSVSSARRSPRAVISLQANCQSQWGRIELVVLNDVSADGCRITTTGAPVDRGARVLIRSASLLGAAGTVRWVDASSAGIEFDSPLPASILQHLSNAQVGSTSLILPNQKMPLDKRTLEHV